MIIIKLYSGLNIKNLKLLGEGTQGKVYRIDTERCIKIFKSKKVCKEEFETLKMAQGNIHFPRLYQAGTDYIIREYIDGIELDKYLINQKLTPQILNKLIELYESMRKLGFNRLDAAIFHILVTASKELKLIDTANVMKKKTQIPNLLISGLDNLGFKEDFFNLLKINRPDLYIQWIKFKKKNYKKMG